MASMPPSFFVNREMQEEASKHYGRVSCGVNRVSECTRACSVVVAVEISLLAY